MCVCVLTHQGWFACVLTARALSNTVVLSVPVPQQQGGISGARQDVAVSTDVRLRASQTRHHVTVPEHDLSQFACKSTQLYKHVLKYILIIDEQENKDNFIFQFLMV